MTTHTIIVEQMDGGWWSAWFDAPIGGIGGGDTIEQAVADLMTVSPKVQGAAKSNFMADMQEPKQVGQE